MNWIVLLARLLSLTTKVENTTAILLIQSRRSCHVQRFTLPDRVGIGSLETWKSHFVRFQLFQNRSATRISARFFIASESLPVTRDRLAAMIGIGSAIT